MTWNAGGVTTSASTPDIKIPADLLPNDGRFGSGPSRVRAEAMSALAQAGTSYMGTSHRKAPVKAMVERLQVGLSSLFSLPDGYEVILGNGGTTVLWDALCFGMIRRRSQHLSFGEFSSKFAKAASTTPFLDKASVISSDPGTHPMPEIDTDIDFYALTHNETSTGVHMPIARVGNGDSLVGVDATSAAGGIGVAASEFDLYYFAPQKCLASDGGLWIALASPAAIARIEEIKESGRWIPASIDLGIALENSRLHQTYNTPALATIFLAVQQVEWMLDQGGMSWTTAQCQKTSGIVYDWASASQFATPFVAKPDERSPVTCVLDIDDAISADTVISVLRKNGIVDTDGYRKLGRNQLRVATFPATPTEDVEALTKCIDFVVQKMN